MIFVGDIHGRVSLVKRIREQFKSEKKIFVGDVVDSFTETIADQVEAVNIICDMTETGEAVYVAGNHEFSYLKPETMRASGYKPALAAHMMTLKHRLWKCMVPFAVMSKAKILVTHAGMTSNLFAKMPKDDIGDIRVMLDRLLKRDDAWVYRVGTARMGTAAYGGIFWCDANKEFSPITGIRQVFGHTPTTMGIEEVWSGNFNIDCFGNQEEVLRYDAETDKFSVISIQ